MSQSFPGPAQTAEVLRDEDLGGGISRALSNRPASHLLAVKATAALALASTALLVGAISVLIFDALTGRFMNGWDLSLAMAVGMFLLGLAMVLRSAARSATSHQMIGVLSPHLREAGLHNVHWVQPGNPMTFTAERDGDRLTFHLAAPAKIPAQRSAAGSDRADSVQIPAQRAPEKTRHTTS